MAAGASAAIRGKKILVTGPAGRVGFPLARDLARDNEVWGISRFRDQANRDRVEAAGVRTRAIDLAIGDFGDLPADFDYVIHTAANLEASDDPEKSLKVNVEGTGLLLAHCRAAAAALVMTTNAVYKAHEDPWRPYVETDPLGVSEVAGIPNYAVSKLGEELVARTYARTLGLPTIVARMNMIYGESGGLPADHLDAIVAGQPVRVRSEPLPYMPIHQRDIFTMLPSMLAAASVPATIVNWSGDEIVTLREWCEYFGSLLGVEPQIEIIQPMITRGVVSDSNKRRQIAGTCAVHWRDGMLALARTRYPELIFNPANLDRST